MKKTIIILLVAVLVYTAAFCVGNNMYVANADKESLEEVTEDIRAAVTSCSSREEYKDIEFKYVRSEYEENKLGEKCIYPTVYFESEGFTNLSKEDQTDFFCIVDFEIWPDRAESNANGHGGLHILSKGNEYTYYEEALYRNGELFSGISDGEKAESWEYGRSFPVEIYSIGLLVIIGIGAILGAILYVRDVQNGKIKPETKKQIKAHKGQATAFIGYYQKTLHYQFYMACKERGVKDINNSADMKIAMNVLKYDHRFAKWAKDTETAKAQYNKACKDISQAEAYQEQIVELDSNLESKEIAQYGKEGYKILQALRKDSENWKLYRDKGVITAMHADSYYIVFSGESSVYTYISKTGEVREGKPSAYVERALEADVVYVPGKATYTSATVGGVTTGGWDIEEAHTELKMTHKGKYAVYIGFGPSSAKGRLGDIWLSKSMMNFVEYNDSLKALLNRKENKIFVGKRSKELCKTVAVMINES